MCVFAAGAIAGCGGTSTQHTPAGLPAVIPFGGQPGPAFYDHPVKVSALPPGIVKTGGTLRSGGVAYAPVGGDLAVIRHSYVGGLLGPAIDDGSSHNGVHLGLGPIIGFDIPLTTTDDTQRGLTLGANAKYLFVNDAAPDLFALNGVVKYWF